MKSLLLPLLVLAASLLHAADKPNMIVIITDDLSYAAFSHTGNPNIQTPNVDKLIDGCVFVKQAYTTHAVCAPSRAGLLTGRYQARFGYETLTGNTDEAATHDRGVDTKELFISDLLKEQGYTTGAFGKWHLGVNEKYQPNARGFDYAFNHVGGCSYTDWNTLRENGQPVEGSGYVPDGITDKALEFMERNKDEPFFMYFATFNVHGPYYAPKKYLPEGATKTKGKKPKDTSKPWPQDMQMIYDGMINAFDAQVGRLMEKLEALDLDENTIVILTNDNGGTKIRMNPPFSGHKAQYYEGGVRTPFAVKWPAELKAGTIYDKSAVSNLDILPTLVAAAGGTLPTDRDFDGVDIMPYLKGDSTGDQDRQLFWRSGAGSHTLRGKYKLHWETDRQAHAAAFKKLNGRKQGREDPPLYDPDYYLAPKLFDLSKDIKEEHDLASQYPELVEQLCKDLREFNKTQEQDRIQGPGN